MIQSGGGGEGRNRTLSDGNSDCEDNVEVGGTGAAKTLSKIDDERVSNAILERPFEVK